MLIVHPFLTGRLARWRQVEQWLEGILDSHDVWFAPLAEICAHVKSVEESGAATIRTENLPYFETPQS